MDDQARTDPNVDLAVAEIREVLRRRELSGFFGLSSKTHTHFSLDFADWSCVTIETREGKSYVRIRAARTMDPVLVNASIGGLVSLARVMKHHAAGLSAAVAQLREHLDIATKEDDEIKLPEI